VKDGNVMALMYKEDGDDPHGRKLICISMYCTYTIKKASLIEIKLFFIEAYMQH
jgi:hypothetical protein